jgi:hypothetical protein
MYVVTQNDQVLLGPINWNYRLIRAVVEDDAETLIDIGPDSYQSVPMYFANNIKIRTAREIRENHNTRIQMLQGPEWSFNENEGVAYWAAVDKPIDLVRKELKDALANIRYNREILGTKVTIQGSLVTVETTRDVRNLFVQQYLLMPADGITRWKFPEGWFDLTKSDLGICVAGGVAYVQSCFDWESLKGNEIDAAINLAQLDVIDLNT